MGNEDILARLDKMIFELISRTGCITWEIRMREDLARELFSDPIPEKYKRHTIVIDNAIDEIQTNEGYQSDIFILAPE